MSIGDINSVAETAYGFRTKLLFFIHRIELSRKRIGKEKNEFKILDIGCGNGTQVTFPLGNEGYRVTGADVHEPSIEFAKANNAFKNIDFFSADISGGEELGFCGKVDAVVLSDIIEHVEKPGKLLKTAAELLEPHGTILISIPNGYGPFEIENFILRKIGIIKLGRFLRNLFAKIRGKEKVPYNIESGHIQFFTQKNFAEIISESGLEITHFRKGCFLGGSVTNAIISRFNALIKLNIKLAEYLPAAVCSVWYFECRKKDRKAINDLIQIQ